MVPLVFYPLLIYTHGIVIYPFKNGIREHFEPFPYAVIPLEPWKGLKGGF